MHPYVVFKTSSLSPILSYSNYSSYLTQVPSSLLLILFSPKVIFTFSTSIKNGEKVFTEIVFPFFYWFFFSFSWFFFLILSCFALVSNFYVLLSFFFPLLFFTFRLCFCPPRSLTLLSPKELT